jgi:hypothetical protein
VSVTLSSTVGQLLGGLQLNLADLLLDEEALFARLGISPRSAPRATDFSQSGASCAG